MAEHFFEPIRQLFIFSFKAIDSSVFIFHLLLKLFDLVFQSLGLILVYRFQLLDFDVFRSLKTADLLSYQPVQLLFLGIPPGEIFLRLTTQFFLPIFKVLYFFIINFYLPRQKFNVLLQLFDQRVFMKNLLLQICDSSLKLPNF